MADDILASYQHLINSLQFITGKGGVFDVRVNGDLLFSKHALGRHAEEGEVLHLFREYVGPGTPTYR